MTDPISHHAINVAAIAVPMSAWIASLIGVVQPIAALILTLCGITYYAQIFYSKWKTRHVRN